jgi:hypothetical protein
MSSALDIKILWWLSTAFRMWIAYQVLSGKLGPSFRYFGLYSALSAGVSLCLSVLMVVVQSKFYYGLVFIIWTYTASIFEFLLVRELSSTTLERFPAIKAASARTLTAFWCILIAVGGAWYLYLSGLPTYKNTALIQAALRYQESVSLGFTLFVLLFLAFVSWMPVPISRNLLTHAFLMGALFLVTSLSRFAIDLGVFATQKNIADYIGLGGGLIVFLVWSVKIRNVVDSRLSTPKGPVDPEAAKIMIARLEELNRSLAASGPKLFK